MNNLIEQILGNVMGAVGAKYDSFVEWAPYIMGALAVFLVGWAMAAMISRSIIAMSEKLRLEVISEKIGLKHFLLKTGVKRTSSHVIAHTIKGYLMFLFFIEATKVAKLEQVANFLTTIISYVPDVMVALFIMLVGIRIGNGMQMLISTSLSFTKSNTSHILGMAAKYTIVTFAVLAALSQLEIAEILIQILFIGFVAMLTIAGGLAFGLGGKDVVKELLEAIKRVEIKELRKNKVVR